MQCTEDSSVDTPDAKKDQTDARGAYSNMYPAGGLSRPSIHQSVPKAAEMDFMYNMNHVQRGYAIIINNQDFDAHTGMSKRNGSGTDAENLHQRFRALGFEVNLKHNQSTTEMLDLLTRASQADHTNADCFVCAILSHGEEGKVWGKDGVIPIELLTSNFRGDKCLSLAGKPKLFFIQACRGNKLDHGVEMTDAYGEDPRMNTVHRIPSEADFLMAYSVVPGYFSWRNSTRGSWFIQALCQVLEHHGDEEIIKIMTRVNKKVAYDFQSNAAKEFMNCKKQIPSIVSMLTKQLYFTNKK